MVTVTFDNDLGGAMSNILVSGDPTVSGGLPNETIYQWDTPGIYTLTGVAMVGDCEVMSEEYTIIVEPELETPVISCTPSTTSIDISWDAIDCASMYIVTIDGVAQDAQSETTFSKWMSL